MISLAMKRGESKRFGIDLTNDDGTPLAGTFSNPRCEWRQVVPGTPTTDSSPCIAAFNTSTQATAVGTATVSFATPNWTVDLTLLEDQSKLLTPGSYKGDLWLDLDGQPFWVDDVTAKVAQNYTVPE